MLHHPTIEKLNELRLFGMRTALIEQYELPDTDALSFEERLGLLVEREHTLRADRRLQTRLRKARLKQNAAIEDIDYRARRGLDKSLIAQKRGVAFCVPRALTSTPSATRRSILAIWPFPAAEASRRTRSSGNIVFRDI